MLGTRPAYQPGAAPQAETTGEEDKETFQERKKDKRKIVGLFNRIKWEESVPASTLTAWAPEVTSLGRTKGSEDRIGRVVVLSLLSGLGNAHSFVMRGGMTAGHLKRE